MISNTNPTSITFETDVPTAVGSSSADGNVSMDDVIKDLRERRQNVLNGGINCIPWPFPRFRIDIPGIEQEQYVVVTAPTKCGKTQFASYVYIYHVLDYCFTHPDQASVHIIYFCLEESQMRIKQRYISHLLYALDGIRISPTDLRSTSADFPLPEEILEKLASEKYRKRLAFFDECVQFECEDTNPTGILRVCEEYAKSVGDYKSYERRSRANHDVKVEVFQSYTPHDKKHYKMCFIDHLGLVDLERGMSLKQSMDKVSEYAVKYLRNRYKYTVVAIQQQAMENEGLDAIKQKKIVPAVATLGDTKYTARDANLVIGLMDPSLFGLQSYQGYLICDKDGKGLRNYGRFAHVLRGRDGEVGGIDPLFFDGATCSFEELPKLDEFDELEKAYQKSNTLKSYKQQKRTAAMKAAVAILYYYASKSWTTPK